MSFSLPFLSWRRPITGPSQTGVIPEFSGISVENASYLDKTDAERYFKGFVVACRENGKESALRLIKHFSSECEDDWEKESGLVNALRETEHPNILSYCWHCKSMY